MATIDTSIYGRIQPADIGGSVQKGLDLASQISKRNAEKAEAQKKAKISELYKNSVGEDGQPDVQKVVTGLSSLGYGEEAMALGRQAKEDGYKAKGEERAQTAFDSDQRIKKLSEAKNQQDFIVQLSGGIKDNQTVAMALQKAEQAGINTSTFPTQYVGYEKFWSDLHGSQLTKKDLLDEEHRKAMLANDAANRAEAREERRHLHGVARQDKNDAKVDAQVQKLSDVLAPAQQVQSSLTGIEAALGFNLDDYDEKTGQVLNRKTGKAEPMKDLPGVSLPGIGRVSGFSTEARNLQSKAAKVFNTELKDRSGAAVTTPELERLKLEFGQGKYNSEPELVAALKQYKTEASLAMKNRQAGFMPEALAEYEKQGGTILKDSSAKTVVKTQTNQKTGEKRVVYSDGSIEMIKSNVAGK